MSFYITNQFANTKSQVFFAINKENTNNIMNFWQIQIQKV